MKYITAQLSHIKKTTKIEEGFTLIELLVVIGILAILMGIVLIAINPARQFALANNTTRENAVNQILNAVGQYAADNKGALPPQITTSVLSIKSGSTNADICAVLVPTYIPALPEDPNILNGADITSANCASYDSGYTITKDANGRVTVAAPDAQLSATISVSR